MANKSEYKAKILEYLADPDNEDWTRTHLAVQVLGLCDRPALYKYFTTAELDDLYAQALEMRRQRYAKDLAKVDRGLIKRAAKGDAQAAKLVFQRYEGWVEKKEQKNTGSLTVIVEGEE